MLRRIIFFSETIVKGELAKGSVKVAEAVKAVAQAAKTSRVVGKAGKVVEKGITAAVKSADLPNSGKIRFIPRAVDAQSGKILQKQGGYVDKFGSIWKNQLGHMSFSGAHLNVTHHRKIPH